MTIAWGASLSWSLVEQELRRKSSDEQLGGRGVLRGVRRGIPCGVAEGGEDRGFAAPAFAGCALVEESDALDKVWYRGVHGTRLPMAGVQAVKSDGRLVRELEQMLGNVPRLAGRIEPAPARHGRQSLGMTFKHADPIGREPWPLPPESGRHTRPPLRIR